MGVLSWWRFGRWSPSLRQVHEGEGSQEVRRQDGSQPQVNGLSFGLVRRAVEEVLRGVFLASAARAQRGVGPAHFVLVAI